ncbi:hypothetical protein [Urbifossiella limnaea]|uniref:Uncharacterized protein n=1 Tax=Urbifossiella limnaea TaxID=2528023 RepID=A0A517Y2D5_9BACT|nr:hypothetical protein [Urbifossiella limnaea]QDU23930.1 hypothetical protein ETAA1_59410 [Urbifossiella limnaea]
MVKLYIAGRLAGTMDDALRVMREAAASRQPVEYREADGSVFGVFTPITVPAPFSEPPCPWEPSLTWEDIERRRQGEMLTFEELKTRLGWE